MEALAYLHLASAYEESSTVEAVILLPKLNLFGLLKQQKRLCKAWIYGLSLSLTLVLLRIFSSALASQMGEDGYQVSNLVSNPISKIESKQNIKTSSPISKLSSKVEPNGNTSNSSSISSPSSKTKSKQNKNPTSVSDGRSGSVHALNHTPLGGIKVDGSLVSQIQTDKNRHLAVLVNDVRKANSHPTISQRATLPAQAPLQHGKLKLKNDTESGALIFLHAPGEEKYNRYAYVPACSERTLLSEYNTRWRVSMNSVHAQQIGVVKGGVLVVETSSLMGYSDDTACNGGLRSRVKQVAATLTNRPQDHLDMSRATYRPVLNPKTEVGEWLAKKFGGQVDDIAKATSPKALNALSPEERVSLLLARQRNVDAMMLDMSAEVLNVAGREANVADKRELIEVARYLKGDGSNLQLASARLKQYIEDCYPTFANKLAALQFLNTLRRVENLKTNLQDKVSPLLVGLTESSGTETPNNSQPLTVNQLNALIEAAPPPAPQQSRIDGIKCVQEQPSIMTRPYPSI